MKFSRISLFALTLLSTVVPSAFGKKLRRVDRATQKDSQESSSKSEGRSDSKSKSTRTGEDTDSDRFALHVVTAPWSFPYLIARSGPPRVLAPRPFAEECGLACLAEEQNDKALALHFELDAGYELSGFPFLETALRIESSFGVGLSTRLIGYRERSSGTVDHALMGKTNLFYRFATTRWAQFRSGLGARFWGGPTAAQVGVNFLYAVDIQWKKPIASSLEFNAGSLGTAGVIELRATLDVYFGHLRIYGGWNQAWIRGVRLGGPIVGLGGYF